MGRILSSGRRGLGIVIALLLVVAVYGIVFTHPNVSNIQIDIYDDADSGYYTSGQDITFYANYSNTTGTAITGKQCFINFTDGFATMQLNVSTDVFYNISSFSSPTVGLTYNVTCNSTANPSVTLSGTKNFNVSRPFVVVPFDQDDFIDTVQPVAAGVNATYYARVINVSHPTQQNLSNPTCNLSVPGTANIPMAASGNPILVQANATIATVGVQTFNVTCDVGGTLYNGSDTVNVLEYKAGWADSGIVFSNPASGSTGFMRYGNNNTWSAYYQKSTNVVNVYDFSDSSTTSTSIETGTGNTVGFFDVDNDNDLDAISLGLSFGAFSPLFTYDSGFSTSGLLSSSINNKKYDTIALADFDNNGWQDLFISGENTSAFSVLYENNQNGSLLEDSGHAFTNLVRGSAVYGDIDNNGFYDLIQCGSSDNTITDQYCNVFYQNISGWSNAEASIAQFSKTSLAIIDYDNNGKLDVIVTGDHNVNGKGIALYNNTGIQGSYYLLVDNGFEPVTYGSIAVADYDNDGLADLFICGDADDDEKSMMLYRNNGTNFIPENVTNVIPPLTECYAAFFDYDTDGDADLIVSGLNDSNPYLKLFENNISLLRNNTPPSPPTITNVTFTTNTLFINWTNGSDDLTPNNALFYNLEVRSTTNASRIYVSGKYGGSSHPTQGYYGNMQQWTNFTLRNVSQDSFKVRLHAIDNALKPGDWSGWYTYSPDTCAVQDTGVWNIDQPCSLNDDTTFGPDLLINVTDSWSVSGVTLNASHNVTILNTGTLSITDSTLTNISIIGPLTASNTTLVNATFNVSGTLRSTTIANATTIHENTTTFNNSVMANTSSIIDANVTFLNSTNGSLSFTSGNAFFRYPATLSVVNESSDALAFSYNLTSGYDNFSSGTSVTPLWKIVNSSGSTGTLSYVLNVSAAKHYANHSVQTFTEVATVSIVLNSTPSPEAGEFTLTLPDLTGDPSTDYAAYSDVTGLVIATSDGKINFSSSVDAVKLNISRAVNISANLIEVDPSLLDGNATLTMSNLEYEKTPAIVKDGSTCTTCTNVSYDGENVSFMVRGFSSYATTNNSLIALTSSTSTRVDHPHTLTVEYRNYSNTSQLAASGSCAINLSGTMTNTNGVFNYTFTPSSVGEIGFNVTCADNSYEDMVYFGTLDVLPDGMLYTFVRNYTGVHDSSVAIGFLTSNNTNDILLQGKRSISPDIRKSIIQKNSGAISLSSNYAYAANAIIDINNDNVNELVYFGETSSGSKVFKIVNISQGSLNQLHSFSGMSDGSLAVFDINNDAYPDILACGKNTSGKAQTIAYLYNKTGDDYYDHDFNITNLQECSIAFNDFDRDGWMDFAIIGENATDEIESFLYKNNRTGFTINKSLNPFGNLGQVTWLTSNRSNDDLIIIGRNSSNQPQLAYYSNNNGNITINTTIALNGTQKATILTGNINNDNFTDLIVAGLNDGKKLYTYLGNTSGFTTDNVIVSQVPAFDSGSAVLYDMDADNDLDLFVTGQTTSGNLAHLYNNTANEYRTNQAPTPPTIINATYEISNSSYIQQGGNLTITWNNGSDDAPGLTYDIRIGNTTHNHTFLSAMRGTQSNPTQGQAGINRNFSYLYNQPNSCFTIQARTIDNTYTTSAWSNPFTFNNVTEACDGYDNDCDGLIDEGYDPQWDSTNYTYRWNKSGTIHTRTKNGTTNILFDFDNDTYVSVGPITVYNTHNTSQNATINCQYKRFGLPPSENYTLFDLTDWDSLYNPGAQDACSGSSYIDYNENSQNEAGSCLGSSDNNNDGSTGSSSGSFPSSAITRESSDANDDTIGDRTTPTNDDEQPREPTLTQPDTTDGSGSDPTIAGIIHDASTRLYKIKTSYTSHSGTTKITHDITSLELPLKNARLRITVPKEIAATDKEISTNHNIKVVDPDPIIDFLLGDLQFHDKHSIEYSIDNDFDPADITAELLHDPVQEEEIQQLEEQIEKSKIINITKRYTQDDESTTFTIDLDFADNETILYNVSIFEEIPKCLVEILQEEAAHSNLDFEIINEDPLIVWHFDQLLKGEQIQLRINAIADEDCLNAGATIALARDIIAVRSAQEDLTIWPPLAVIAGLLLLLVFMAQFTREKYHIGPEVQVIVRQAKRMLRKRHTLEDIEAKLKAHHNHQDVTTAIDTLKHPIRRFFVRTAIGLETTILFSLIVLNILDFLKILPGDVDFVKKIISWILLALVFYHVGISRVLFGRERRWVDITLIASFFLLTMKNVIPFARATFLETQFVRDLYVLIINNNVLFETVTFAAGIVGVLIVAIIIAIKKHLHQDSFYGALFLHNKKHPTRFGRFWRILFVQLLFFILVFNLMFEWLAIAVDAPILVAVLIITVVTLIVYKVRKHYKTTPGQLIEQITETPDHFYEKIIDLFHHPKFLPLGIAGMFVLHAITEIGIYLIPYTLGVLDPVYIDILGNQHTPLFSLASQASRFAQSAGLFNGVIQAQFAAGYALNIIGLLIALLIPVWLWHYMYRHKHKPLFSFSIFHAFIHHESRRTEIIAKSLLLIAPLAAIIALAKPAFSFAAISGGLLAGVDILTHHITIDGIVYLLSAGLLFSLLTRWVERKHLIALTSILLAGSAIAIACYDVLYLQSMALYVIKLASLLHNWEGWLTILRNSTVIVTLVLTAMSIGSLYVIAAGLVGFMYLPTRAKRWVHGLLPSHIAAAQHHHHIHYHHLHDHHIHGEKVDHLKEHIEDQINHGHELFVIADNLHRHGWPWELIEQAVVELDDTKRFDDDLKHLRKKHHKKEKIAKLATWIQKHYDGGKSLHAIILVSRQHGWTEEDIRLALIDVELKRKDRKIADFLEE